MPKGKPGRTSQCSGCGQHNPRAPKQRYCTSCHAAYMRAHRPKHSELTPIQKWKSNARAYANTYQRRGMLEPKPCETCGAEAEKHHEDYSKPLMVRWLCRECHLREHRQERLIATLKNVSRPDLGALNVGQIHFEIVGYDESHAIAA